MNDSLLDQLFAKAREAPPHDVTRAEHGFETRLMARLRAGEPGMFPLLAVWQWRLLPIFVLLTLVMSWNLWHQQPEREFAIRSALEESSVEWAYVEGLTGRYL
ncbi:MAG TPA: hypothetical protein VNQ90_14950 [Chthoniobacteraceae bacterium]|nr:hypothetical protein [Chthoniobacteraceae bacterium]